MEEQGINTVVSALPPKWHGAAIYILFGVACFREAGRVVKIVIDSRKKGWSWPGIVPIIRAFWLGEHINGNAPKPDAGAVPEQKQESGK